MLNVLQLLYEISNIEYVIQNIMFDNESIKIFSSMDILFVTLIN